MNFILHFTIPDFVRALTPQCSVYAIAYSQNKRDGGKEAFVLLTSDAGLEGGTVRVLQLRIKEIPSEEAVLELATQAAIKITKFLREKDVKTPVGVLLTAGLQDAVQYWGSVVEYSLEELDPILEKGKEVVLSEQ